GNALAMKTLGQGERSVPADDDEAGQTQGVEVADHLGGAVLFHDDPPSADRVLEGIEAIRGPEDGSTLAQDSTDIRATLRVDLLADEAVEAVLDPVDLPVELEGRARGRTDHGVETRTIPAARQNPDRASLRP